MRCIMGLQRSVLRTSFIYLFLVALIIVKHTYEYTYKTQIFVLFTQMFITEYCHTKLDKTSTRCSDNIAIQCVPIMLQYNACVIPPYNIQCVLPHNTAICTFHTILPFKGLNKTAIRFPSNTAIRLNSEEVNGKKKKSLVVQDSEGLHPFFQVASKWSP